MSKKLIITEKPSVAADLARALGGFVRHDDYFESDDYILSSAVGHLLELACPEEYEVKRGKWSFAHLPVIPPYFALQPMMPAARAGQGPLSFGQLHALSSAFYAVKVLLLLALAWRVAKPAGVNRPPSS